VDQEEGKRVHRGSALRGVDAWMAFGGRKHGFAGYKKGAELGQIKVGGWGGGGGGERLGVANT